MPEGKAPRNGGRSLAKLFRERDKPPNYIVSVLLMTFRILVVLVLLAGFAGLGLVVGIAKAYYETVPELDVSAIEDQNLSSFIYDSDGNLLTAYTGSENRVWASIDEIPQTLRDAFIAVEDARFRSHNGVDLKRIVGAFVSNLRNDSVQGGSTITQQLVKNTLLTSEQSYKRKIQEAYIAMELERQYNKDQILEWYLNIIWLGGSNYGVRAAAQDYYGKDLGDLTLRECAMLASITRNPSNYNPRRNYFVRDKAYLTDDRTDYVLSCMYENNLITKGEYDAALAEKVSVVETTTVNQLYDMPAAVESVVYDVCTELLEKNGLADTSANRTAMRRLIQTEGYSIHSTIDPGIQHVAENTVYNYEGYPDMADPSSTVQRIKNRDGTMQEIVQPQTAAVIYDYREGEVRAIVGGRTAPTSYLEYNRARDSTMPVGSAIKPLSVYGPALDMGMSPGMVTSNDPLPITGWNTAKGYPSNATSGTFLGKVTLRRALRSSLNTASATLLMNYVTIPTSVSYLVSMGVDIGHINQDGAGLALGSSGITPLEMTVAYGAIANEGTYLAPLTFTRVEDSDGNVIIDAKAEQQAAAYQVFKKSTAYMLVDMLIGNVETGIATNARIDGLTVGGKTGTNSDYIGVSFAGITPDYSCAVWVGSDEYKPLYSGASGNREAAPLWRALMTNVYAALDLVDHPIIDVDPYSLGLTKVTLCSATGLLAGPHCDEGSGGYNTTTDWCALESVPTKVCDRHAQAVFDAETGLLATPYCANTYLQNVLLIYEDDPVLALTAEKFKSLYPNAVILPQGVSIAEFQSYYYLNPAYSGQFCPLHTVAVPTPSPTPVPDGANGGAAGGDAGGAGAWG